MKENELQYVKKEVQCLREELQMMQKVGVFWEQLGKQQGREGREAPGLRISGVWLGLMGCSRQTLLSPVLLVLADCRARSSSSSVDWRRLTLYKGRVTQT